METDMIYRLDSAFCLLAIYFIVSVMFFATIGMVYFADTSSEAEKKRIFFMKTLKILIIAFIITACSVLAFIFTLKCGCI